MNRYKNIPERSIRDTRIKSNGPLRAAKSTVRYPEIPLSPTDIYVISDIGDRFDTLANDYYKDPTLWWVISIANTGNVGTSLSTNLSQDSLYIPVGIQIRIPLNVESILNVYNAINQS